MLSYLKKRIQNLYLKKQHKCNSTWYGSEYGGFGINPNALSAKSIVYSFGVGCDISFDLELIKEFNLQIFAFDPTPKSINWINTQELPSNFTFFPFGVAKQTGNVKFKLPKNSNYVSGSILEHKGVNINDSIDVPMKSFLDIVNQLGHDKIDVLKMDIEGTEYDVLEDILKLELNINQFAIEFHPRFFSNGKLKNKQIISLFNQFNYKIFYISDSLDEISFIKVTN